MTTRADVIAEARQWLHTPFLHQGAAKGAGADCVGLVRGVCAALGLWSGELTDLPNGHAYVGYSDVPDGRTLQLACDSTMTRIAVADARPADVFMLAWDKEPQHIGFLADYHLGGLSVIHALGAIGRKGRVIEQRLTDDLRRKFVAAYRIEGLD